MNGARRRTRRGLACCASRSLDDVELTEEDDRAFADAGLCLCGGIFSGSESSFREKAYRSLADAAAGVGIGEDLTPDQRAEPSRRLDAMSAGQPSGLSQRSAVAGDRHGPAVCASLQRFFRICAERSPGLVAWD